jgi:hypothetical protein
MGLLKNMKEQINKAGGSRGKVFYVKADSKARIRFLVDFEDGAEFTFHDSFHDGINAICQEELGKSCPLCDMDNLRTRKLYCWPIWNYETKEVQLLLYAANNFTPVPAFIGLFETYGTLMDRDFVISRTGKEKNTSYSVIPMDKANFRNKKAKVPTRKAILKILDEAFPVKDGLDFDDDDDSPKKSKNSDDDFDEYEDDFDEEDDEDDDDDDDELLYEEMSPKELYRLCKARKIKCKPRKKANYYIDKLEEADLEEELEDEDTEDDEW